MKLSLFILIYFSFCEAQYSKAQDRVLGNIYDQSKYIPIPKVEVLSNYGQKAFSDSTGAYEIEVLPHDSIWFYFHGKATQKYAVEKINTPAQFDISIHLKESEENRHWLPPVIVKNYRNYRLDSTQNRREYARIFNPDKGGLSLVRPDNGGFGGVGVALDLDEIIKSFSFAKNKRLELYRQRITEDEQYNYIRNRFSDDMITKLTGLEGENLKEYVNMYLPDYYFVTKVNDIDLGKYVVNTYKQYKRYKSRQKAKPKSIFAEPEN